MSWSKSNYSLTDELKLKTDTAQKHSGEPPDIKHHEIVKKIATLTTVKLDPAN